MTDYDFYKENYLAGREAVFDAASFPFWERKASQTVRNHTFGNIDENKPVSEEVQMCICEVAECLYRQNTEESNGNVASETVGKLSVTYKTKSSEEKKNEVYDIICSWLSGTGLMYQGV